MSFFSNIITQFFLISNNEIKKNYFNEKINFRIC